MKKDDSVFLYSDTASVRSEVVDLSHRLSKANVAIIGLGGTGSYILDMVSKTPVPEIHLFDGDEFLSHNAFRSPGAASVRQLRARDFKVDYFARIYGRMRRGIIPHQYYMTSEHLGELRDVGFVFVSMDKGSKKQPILRALQDWGIPFVDVGMGLQRDKADLLGGQIRVTASTAEKQDHVWTGRIPLSEGDLEDNEYATNIQIAELNALNATLAVIRWKKLWGFYQDLRHAHHSSYMLDTNSISNEETPIIKKN